MKQIRFSLEKGIRYFAYIILTVIFAYAFVALFAAPSVGEANIGSFAVDSLNEGWRMEIDGQETIIELPKKMSAPKDTVITIKNTLPEYIEGKYELCARSSLSNMEIYINGELREEYSSDKLDIGYYIPSAYVFTELATEDAGAEIVIRITSKAAVTLNEVYLAPGNGVWLKILKENAGINIIAVIVFALGILAITVCIAGRKRLGEYKVILYLGFVMIDLSLWIFSESRLRQLLFSRVSLTEIFTYFTIEILGVFVVMYFDEVQHEHYHKQYLLIQTLMALQLFANIVLHVLGVCELYRSLVLSHIWTAVGIAFAFGATIWDVIRKRIAEYIVVAFGMLAFLLLATAELISFYTMSVFVFGFFTCLGLLALLITTVIQLLYDQKIAYETREKEQTQSFINTIETISLAIDAKDEYTGGHSQRVGTYAQILAKDMAKDYGFTEEDILRIHYIGLVHDIGKIGVADPVLNKPGKLTDEEFSLMKKHADIGYELMYALGGNLPGLLDGIRYHHERYDGNGYPMGLKGKDIPLEARILCVADCYDAMTSNRVYRKRLSDEEVIAEIEKCSGSLFDPDIADRFSRLLRDKEIVAVTSNGMETDEHGRVYLSSVLENRLHKDLFEDEASIKNPTFIRMLCYLVKLFEKQNGKVYLSIVDADEVETKNFTLKKPDVKLQYTDKMVILGLFGWSAEEEEKLPDFVKAGQLKEKIW